MAIPIYDFLNLGMSIFYTSRLCDPHHTPPSPIYYGCEIHTFLPPLLQVHPISLGYGCWTKGIAIHETMHTMGEFPISQ
jgi:hypothetical protein